MSLNVYSQLRQRRSLQQEDNGQKQLLKVWILKNLICSFILLKLLLADMKPIN